MRKVRITFRQIDTTTPTQVGSLNSETEMSGWVNEDALIYFIGQLVNDSQSYEQPQAPMEPMNKI